MWYNWHITLLHYILMTYLFYKFVSFGSLHVFYSPRPFASGNNQSVLYIWTWFLFCFVFLSWFLDSTYKWDHTVFVFLWLISLSIMTSMSMHTVTNSILIYGWIVLQRMCVCVCVCVSVWITFSLSIHPLMDIYVISISWLL